MSKLDEWSGEENALYGSQKDNAYVSRAQFDDRLMEQHARLVALEHFRGEWSELKSDDWKSIKAFIDGYESHPFMDEFMRSHEKKAAGLVSVRMSPKTYYQWKIVKSMTNNNGLADFVETIVSNTYQRLIKSEEEKQDD